MARPKKNPTENAVTIAKRRIRESTNNIENIKADASESASKVKACSHTDEEFNALNAKVTELLEEIVRLQRKILEKEGF